MKTIKDNHQALHSDQPAVTGLAAKGAAVNVVELFSGIGGFTKGLMDAGMKINKHYYSEIDKHAIANYKYNFKDAEYIGSVTDVRGSGIERPNIITFGSPCQDFSLAGKRKGMEGQRSSLILHAIRLIGECRPDFFIWENVKGAYSSNDGADFWGIIQAFTNIGGYRLEWQLLNTSWFLPQNRERIYLIGHLAKDGRDFKGIFPISESDEWNNQAGGEGELRSENPQIAGTLKQRDWKGGTNFIQYGKGSQDTKLSPLDGNSQTLNAGHFNQPKIIQTNKSGQQFENDYAGTLRGEAIANYMVVKTNTKEGEEIAEVGDSINFSNPSSKTRRGRVGKGKAQTLDTASNQAVIVAQRGRGENNEQQFEARKDGITNSLTSVEKDNYVFLSEPTHKHGEERIYNGNGDAPTIQSRYGTGGDNIPYVNNIRRLTEIECERLQGFPDVKKRCIFALWKENYSEYQKSFVSADTQNPKRQSPVGSVEKNDFQGNVLFAEMNLNTSNPQIKKLAQNIVLINCEDSKVEILSQGKLLLSVSNVGEIKKSVHQIKIEDFVLQLVRINSILERTTTDGREVLHPKEQYLIHQKNGRQVLNWFGSEIMQPVKDANSGTITKEKLTKSTISNLSGLEDAEQNLPILFYYVLNAISSFIPKEMLQENLLIEVKVKHGWTEFGNYDGVIKSIPKTQRYKLLGNAVTVNVVKAIGCKLLAAAPFAACQ